jgi:arylsulfatase A-like enzyme
MSTSKRPHVVIFNPDQWRGDVMGHHGNAAAVTPNLDRLVKTEAVSFSRAFCQNPVCTPSRSSFMTGWYPHTRGHRTIFHMLHPHEGEPVLLKRLKDSGYHVVWAGKNDLVPREHGFDSVCDVKVTFDDPKALAAKYGGSFGTDSHSENNWRGNFGEKGYYSFLRGKLQTADGKPYMDSDWLHVHEACRLIREHKGDKPLCVYLPLGYPHPPYAIEEPYYSMIDAAAIPERTKLTDEQWKLKPSILRGILKNQDLVGWPEEKFQEVRKVYYAMCARVDAQFGMVMQALKDAGFYDETAMFFFSDHGDFTGDYGLVEKTQNTFEDCLTRVPFIVKPPKGKQIKPGVNGALVELVDFSATVYEWTGIEPGYTSFGKSLSGVIAGEDEHRDAVFCEGGRLLGEEEHCSENKPARPYSTVEGGFYWPRISLQAKIPEHTKAVMCRDRRFKYVHRLYEADELYDMVNDPMETNNIAGLPENEAVVRKFKDRVLKWFMETADVVPFHLDGR